MKELMSMTVNGKLETFAVRPAATLLEVLREDLGLTGTKRGCDHGDCGACTVLVDGEPRLSCITLALSVRGHRIQTIEGLAAEGYPHRIQEAFDRHGAAQCGFCTPGMLMSASALVAGKKARTREEIRDGLSGNLCRCTGFKKIVDAVEDACRGEAEE